jgi:hypothetical protein
MDDLIKFRRFHVVKNQGVAAPNRAKFRYWSIPRFRKTSRQICFKFFLSCAAALRL